MQERPDLSEMKSNLMVNNARMKAELSLLEDTILQMLSASEGNILDDENLINTLAVSKVCNAAPAVTLACYRAALQSRECPSAMQCISPSL